MEIGCQRVRKW